jgi:hypothetical protein
MRQVQVDAIPLDRLTPLLSPERAERLAVYATRARELLDGRIVWNINATATGGGVAEMLQALLAYGRGAGADTRWLTLDGTRTSFGSPSASTTCCTDRRVTAGPWARLSERPTRRCSRTTSKA